jgi:hypothetical protein
MNKATTLTSAIAASMVLSSLYAPHAAAAWSGWARCELDIQGPRYAHREPHTWFVANATPTSRGTGSWSAVGGGHYDDGNPAVQSQHAEWSNNANVANGASFGVPVNAGIVEIRPRHAQLRQSHGILGYVLGGGCSHRVR